MICVKDIFETIISFDETAEYSGDPLLELKTFCPINKLENHAISWVKQIDNFDFSCLSKESKVLIICNHTDKKNLTSLNIICCDNPKQAFFKILDIYFKKEAQKGIMSNSVVETAKIGEEVSIGYGCYIGPEVILGNRVQIFHNVIIDGPTIIGDDVIIHSGVVIGTDGYGYYQDNNKQYQKVPHYGGVSIGSFCEIGANACIDRGTLGNTTIGTIVKLTIYVMLHIMFRWEIIFYLLEVLHLQVE